MEELNNKITGGQLTADEWNQVPSELQNIITAFGQVLSNADLNQVGKSIAGYVANGNFYNAGGTVDVITLSVIGSRQGVLGYSDGMEIAFFPIGNNTVAVTVEVGTLGAVPLTYPNGGALSDDELEAGRISVARYDSTNARFLLMNNFGRLNIVGNVSLSSSTSSSLDASDRTAATPLGVKKAFDLATANSKLALFAAARVSNTQTILGSSINIASVASVATGVVDVFFTTPFSSVNNMNFNCNVITGAALVTMFSIVYQVVSTSRIRVVTVALFGSSTPIDQDFSITGFDMGL